MLRWGGLKGGVENFGSPQIKANKRCPPPLVGLFKYTKDYNQFMDPQLNSYHPNRIPPSTLAKDLNRYLKSQNLHEQEILDYGCASGRNAQYLAGLGHVVVGVSLELEEVKMAAKYDFNARSSYVVGDVRRPMFSKLFDVVLLSEVLHMMPKADSAGVLRSTRGLTKRGGLNAVSGYLLSEEVQSTKNKAQCLRPYELLESYTNIGWDILDYREDVKPVAFFNGQEIIISKATIVAKRPTL